VLSDAKAAGLDVNDELVLEAETILQEYDEKEAAEAEQRAARMVAAEQLQAAMAVASTRLEAPVDREDIPYLIEAKLGLIQAITNARSLGLRASDLKDAERCRRRIHLKIQDLRGMVRVFCRVRPLNAREISCGDTAAVRIINGSTLEIPEVGAFTFDGIFAPGSQQDTFEDCRDLIQGAIDGHNVTIFSYGQTGAGKTYTMTGTPEDEGLVFNAIDEVFNNLDALPSGVRAQASTSMCELYNGHIVDLLRPSSSKPPVGRNDSLSRSISTPNEGLTECKVHSRAELRSLLTKGLQRRAVSAHTMNAQSSRSHLIFTIGVCTVDSVTNEVIRGKVVLCDLAGSERLKKSESQGVHQKEAIEINKSLNALGNVIEAAASGRKVPYREHKLTQILQDSIGGTAKTLMIVNCSPATSNINETVTSLRYGMRAKRVTNNYATTTPKRFR
jgi:hypothetical protein